MKKGIEVLKEVFGYDTFRFEQESIINSVLNKKNVVAIMPTGSGKSLCYQIPALIFEGLTIVVSPLISLMKDQVIQLKENGVEAIYLNSTLSYSEYQENINLILNRSVKIIYAAPETLLLDRTLDILTQVKVDLIAIDEAHCISEWGHDFRPEYRQLVKFSSHFPDASIIALTATATQRVREDIVKNIGVEQSEMYISSFNRENLMLEVVTREDAFSQTVEFISKFPKQSGLIYCFSRKQVDELSSDLIELGYSALPYHAGLSNHDRESNQEAFIRDDAQIIVATIAFGMGINKPDIRFVLHHDLPKNIENYYQQIGRAGRDGLDAHCRLLYSFGDVSKIKYFINQKSQEEQVNDLRLLKGMINFCEAEECRRTPLLEYFGENYTETNCKKCDNCLNPDKEKQDLTVEAQKFFSCVKRSGEIFGASYIIKILRGSKDKKILARGDEKLSTYGIGKDLSSKQWNHLVRQLVRYNLCFRGEFESIKLNAESWKILKGEQQFFGSLIEEKKKQYEEVVKDYDIKLYDILRDARKATAEQKGIPPYVVFSNRTLIDIATYYPQSRESLFKMQGLGEKKIELYADLILTILDSYCEENNYEDKTDSIIITKKPSSSRKSSRVIEVGNKFNSGLSLKEIVSDSGVLTRTIVENLHKFKLLGNELNHRVEVDLPQEEIELIETTFIELGVEYLKPVYERLIEKYTYELLATVRLNIPL